MLPRYLNRREKISMFHNIKKSDGERHYSNKKLAFHPGFTSEDHDAFHSSFGQPKCVTKEDEPNIWKAGRSLETPQGSLEQNEFGENRK
ncbi:hypothetical protein TNCT_109631 [Trichonephila clavata]|uniref:Uncharacterized protein n=1 Tax=Trichonephila clavata TaxID=2740835 RepID=A0A8X6LY07_TRICU|nr:hypothetical protein TNCT_109631 [Trichonephila clavata]